MADYKSLGCCASDLEAAAAHCGDSEAHITAEEREAWNAMQKKGVELYMGTDDVQTVECDTTPYSYFLVGICTSSAGHWYYEIINKGNTTIPICRLNGDVMQVGRVNTTVTASSVSIGEFTGYNLSTAGVTASSGVTFRIRRVIGFYV